MLKYRLVSSYNSIGAYGGTEHLKPDGADKTLCGRDASNWMDMRAAELSDIESAWTCGRCVKRWSELPVV